MDPAPHSRFSLLGVDFPLAASREELRKVVLNALDRGGEGRFLVALNPEKILLAREDAALRQAIAASSGNYADGIGLVLALRWIQGASVERVAGVDWFQEVLRILDERRGSVFLFGASEEANRVCAEEVRRRFPGVTIAGRRNGFDRDRAALRGEIERARPDFIAVALGSPAQERWMLENAAGCGAKLLMGVGGTFDVVSGRVRRAPAFLRNLGLEWAYRFARNPSRIFRLRRLVVFAAGVFRQRFRPLPR